MDIRELTPNEAYAELDRYRIIDVRQDHEFHGPLGAIEAAELFPIGSLEEHVGELGGSRPLLFVCRSGRRSHMACELMQKHDVTNVTNLAAGMIGWNTAELPLLRTEPKTLGALVDQIVAWAAQIGPLTDEAARDVVRDRFNRVSVDEGAPSHAAVEDLIEFFGRSLAQIHPPDLEMSLAVFRSSLAVL